MSKFKRFLIFLVVLGGAFFFLWPTIRWYFVIPENLKTLAMGSREQIREYSLEMARTDVIDLKAKIASDPSAPLPESLSFIVKDAKKENKANGRGQPAAWNVKSVLYSLGSERAVLDAIESRYRTRIMDVKNLRADAIQLGLDLSGGMSIIIKADLEALKVRYGRSLTDAERKDAMARALEVLKSKIDAFGLMEPVIRQMGADQIYVEIPGAADPERIKSIIMGKGNLGFYIVNTELSASVQAYLKQNPTGIDSAGKLSDPNLVPEGFVIRKEYTRDKYGIDEFTGKYYVVTKEAGLDGSYITGADPSTEGTTGRPAVSFKLSKEGADKFYQLTSANVNKPMSIILDDKVKSVATIQSAISDSGQISGLSAEEMDNVVKLLRTAALPVNLEVSSQQAIGASLGDDAIIQGRNALILALALVFIFMLAYYKGAGINAMIAQILNLYLMIGVLSAFNLTLSLPSIAGFVLTIGMAVDANVIIFERIKEELRLGKGRKASISAGFNKAFWAIFDGNLTTIIAGLFLALLGSGPIQGFAISLVIGNISSLFTAIFVSHLIFDFGTEVFKSKNVSISWRVK
jgi:preprotein translocase subunit SecD